MKKNKKKLAALALTGIIFLASCEKENLTEENKSELNSNHQAQQMKSSRAVFLFRMKRAW